MSYVAALLLFAVRDEYLAFNCFCNLMQREKVFQFYSFDMAKVNVHLNVYTSMMKKVTPQVFAKFTDSGVQP